MIRRAAQRLLRFSLPPAERDAALGDLDEQYVHTSHTRGRRRAATEYVRQAIVLAAYGWMDRAQAMPPLTDLVRALLPDIRDAARSLARSPGFTMLAVLSLAIGIGATSTISGLMYDVLWRPLPVPHPERLISLERIGPKGRDTDFTYAEFTALEAATDRAAFTVTRDEDHVIVATRASSAYVVADLVGGSFFEVMGLRPRAGRFIDADDERQGARVAVVSERFWQAQMGADPNVVGSEILVRGVPFTVVGVAPAAFRGYAYPGWFNVALPITTAPSLGWRDFVAERSPALMMLGRLDGPVADGGRLAVESAFNRCCAAEGERLTATDMSHGIGGGKNDFRPDVRALLFTLSGGVVLLLILSCTNVAVLLITRASQRGREISLRMSLGASRARVIRRELIESALLAAIGGGAGYGVAVACRRVLPSLLPRNLSDMSSVIRFENDGASMLGAMLISAAAVLLVGLLPALDASRVDAISAIKSGGRGTVDGRGHRFERAGVTLQIAIALLLTSVGAMMATTLWKLSHVDTGLATSQVYLAPIETRGTPLERDGLVPSHARILEGIRAIPGVTRAGMASLAPFVGGRTSTRSVALAGTGAVPFKAILVAATPDYLETVGVRMVSGRSFGASDATNPSVVVVSQSLAHALGTDIDVVGRQLRFGTPAQTATIVGVAADVHMRSLRADTSLLVYAPAGASGPWPFFELAIASSRPRADVERDVRAAVVAAEPAAHLQFVTTLETEVAASLVQERFASVAALIFAAVSLGIAALGVYGVIAQHVGRRASEFGLRSALGAQRGDIQWLVTRSLIAMAWKGVAIGTPLAVAAGFALAAQLYGVSPFEPRLFAAALATLGAAMAIAAAAPARRAARTDILSVLRE
jgi:putative ABC transport system permease protein